jgi:hypothetical protein
MSTRRASGARRAARSSRSGTRPPPAGQSRRRLYLHRAVAVIDPGRVEIRPALSAAYAPLAAFVVGAGAFAIVLAVALGMYLPIWLAALALLVAVVLLPIAGMGFVYSIVGASVVIDATKRSATWQQGVLGLGVGTRELVPFEKVAAVVVELVSRGDAAPGERRAEPVLQWDLVLEKTSGRRLTVGTVSVLAPLGDQAYERIVDLGAEVARITGAPLRLPAE